MPHVRAPLAEVGRGGAVLGGGTRRDRLLHHEAGPVVEAARSPSEVEEAGPATEEN